MYKKKFYFDQLKQTVLNSGKLTKKLNLTNANSNSKLYWATEPVPTCQMKELRLLKAVGF